MKIKATSDLCSGKDEQSGAHSHSHTSAAGVVGRQQHLHRGPHCWRLCGGLWRRGGKEGRFGGEAERKEGRGRDGGKWKGRKEEGKIGRRWDGGRIGRDCEVDGRRLEVKEGRKHE